MADPAAMAEAIARFDGLADPVAADTNTDDEEDALFREIFGFGRDEVPMKRRSVLWLCGRQAGEGVQEWRTGQTRQTVSSCDRDFSLGGSDCLACSACSAVLTLPP